MSPKPFVLALLLLISLASTHATRYEIFDHGIYLGEENMAYSMPYSVLSDATDEVLKTFNQKEGEGKKYDTVILSIESFAQSPHADAVAITKDNVIRLNADYPDNFEGDVVDEVQEFAGVVYHEMTHVWQWTGNGMAPEWLIDGIADYVRLQGGYASKVWPRRGSGSSWKDGCAVTAYFLDYCNGLKRGFIAELNALMKDSYSDAFFVQLLGKTVHELWLDYKLAYGTTRIPGSEEGYRKPYTRTHPFDNDVQWKINDVPMSNADWKPLENNNYFRITINGVELDPNNLPQNDIPENTQDLGWLIELADMLDKNDVPIPSVNSRKLDPNGQRTADRTSRSQIDKAVTNWQA